MTRIRAYTKRMAPVLAAAGRLLLAVFSVAVRVALTAAILLAAGLEWALPRLARVTGPFRRRLRRRLRREWRTVRLTPIRSALAAAVLGVVALNGAVRWSGGSPGWLDPRHLSDKARAVWLLGRHHCFHRPDGAVAEHLAAAARQTGVPEAWLWAFARTESGLRPHVISHAGAMGLMQLMPDTALEVGVGDPFDPADNALGAARYLARLRKRYGGDLGRVAAAYHAGPGAVPVRGRMRIGATTRRYVRAIQRRLSVRPGV